MMMKNIEGSAARTVTGLAAAALLLASAGLGRETGGPDRVTLKFAPAPGTNIVYAVQAKVNGDGKDFLSKSLRMEALAQGEVDLKALDASSGFVRAGMTIPGIDIGASMADSDMHGTLKTKPGRSLEVVFNSAGKVLSIRNPEVLEQDFEANMSFSQILSDYFPVMPARPVAVGDTWSDTRTIRVPFSGANLSVTLKTEYRLDDILPSPDGRTAYITTFYTAVVHGETALGQGTGVFEGQGTGTGFLHVLPDSGIFSTYQTSFLVQAKFVIKNQGSVLLSCPFSFDSFSLITLNRLEPPQDRSGPGSD